MFLDSYQTALFRRSCSVCWSWALTILKSEVQRNENYFQWLVKKSKTLESFRQEEIDYNEKKRYFFSFKKSEK